MSQRPTVVAVIGSFNSGKSALINALLEQPGLLQEDILPCTNSLFWLRHHDVKEQHFDISLRGPEAIQRTTVAVGSRVELRLKLPQLLEFEFIDTAGTGDVEQPLAFDQVKEIVDLADIVIICWQLAGGLKADDRRMLDRLNLDRKRAVHVATHALHCGNGDMKQAQRKWNSLPEEFLTRFAGGHCVDLKTPKVAPEGWPWAFMSSPAGIWDDLRRMRRGGIVSSQGAIAGESKEVSHATREFIRSRWASLASALDRLVVDHTRCRGWSYSFGRFNLVLNSLQHEAECAVGSRSASLDLVAIGNAVSFARARVKIATDSWTDHTSALFARQQIHDYFASRFGV